MASMSKPAESMAPPPGDPALRALMPNLFIIGASKSGSSALHSYLEPHPDICMSREKEPCFFVDRAELAEAWPIMARQPCSHDWAAYLDLWSGGETAKYRGEGRVYYSQTPHRSGIPARIASVCPDARFIYTVREPVSRAITHYWQRFKEFQEPLSIEDAMRQNALYRDSSDYALQLKAYYDYFDPSRVKVVIAEDLRTRRRAVMKEILDWLELPPYDYTDEELTDRHKSPPTSRKERFPLVRELRNSKLWAAARNHLPKAMVERMRGVATVTFDKDEVDDSAAVAYLRDYLAPRRAEFEAMIGRHVTAWD